MNNEVKEQLKYLLLSYGDREADEKFIRTAISIVVKGMNLENYASNIVFISRDNHMNPEFEKYTQGIAGMFAQAAYVKKDKAVVIYERNLGYMKDMFLRKEGIIEERNIFKNLLILQTLLHELEHANQDRLVKEGDTIEAEFLKALEATTKPLTTMSYDVSPTERGAEIKSIDQTIELARYVDVTNPQIFDILYKMRNEQMERGYDFKFEGDYIEACPLKQYVDLRGIDTTLLEEVLSKLDEELYAVYGCPLELQELEAKTGKHIRIQS